MADKYFKEGTIIKGSDLKGYMLCKILSEDLVMRGFQYRMGMNEDVNPLDISGRCKSGLHFCFKKDICNNLDYGTKLAVVSVPDDEDVYVDDGIFRSHRLVIEKIMPLWEASTWECLNESYAAITAENNYAVRWAAANGYLEVVEYLHKRGADINACNGSAVINAAKNGHLEVVKYLCENRADINSCFDFLIEATWKRGHLEVVRYLIMAKNKQ